VRKDVDFEDAHSHDIRGRLSGTTSLSAFDKDGHELRVVVGHNNTDSERAHDEEEAESVGNRLEGSLDVDGGSLSLSSHH